MKRRVLRANPTGFCDGVKRAMDMVEREAARPRSVCTLGEIIHNPVEVQRIAGLGVKTIASSSGLTGEESVVLSSSGAKKEDVETLRRLGVSIVDGICPLVRRSLNIILKEVAEGERILLAGDPKHSETVNLTSYGEGRVDVIPDIETAHAAAITQNATLLSQTTLGRELFDSIRAVFEQRFNKTGYRLTVRDTICPTTRKRQTALLQLLPEVDAVVVIGGKKSANTRELYDICRKALEGTGKQVFLVQSAAELPRELPASIRSVGLAAGASTPEYIIEEVERCVR